MTLRQRFNLALLVVFLVGFGAGAGLIVSHTARLRAEAALHEARLLTAETTAIDRYTREVVTPAIAPENPGEKLYLPVEAGFAAVAQQARLLRQAFPDVTIRRVVLDPVGPDDTPDGQERGWIMRLREAGAPDSLVLRPDAGRLVLASALRMAPGVCATCYPSLQDAPPGIQDTFGGAHGFNRRPDEIVGATVVSVPLPPGGAVVPSILALGAALALMWASADFALRRWILVPIARIASVAERASVGENAPEFDENGAGAIGELTRAFNRLRRSMNSAIELLDS